ncbi:ABC transporter permease [Anaerolentibacter hominis]|uniref:ABC transporter permease n=1 Tax=Anaerolentibacter hominis TaxID=3079009 RepID=UPI0031B8A348
MSLWKRIWLYITRKKLNTVVLVCTIFVLAVLMFMAFAFQRSSKLALTSLAESFGDGFEIRAIIDGENPNLWKTTLYDNGTISKRYIGPALNSEMVDQVIEMEGIKDYNVRTYTYIYMEGINTIPGNWANIIEEANNMEQEVYADEIWDYAVMQTQTFNVNGNRKGELDRYFKTGAFEIINGRNIELGDRNKIVISEEVALLNNLAVGDTIDAVVNTVILSEGSLDEVLGRFPLEVIGVFRVNSTQAISYYSAEQDIADNFMFMDIESLQSIIDCMPLSIDTYDSASFYVDDPDEIDSMIEEIYSKKDFNRHYFEVKPDTTLYQSADKSLRLFKGIMSLLLIIIIVACFVILSLILSFALKNRNRESGILLSIGIEKKQILQQYSVECLLVALFSLILAFGAANIICQPLGNQALKLITPQQEQTEVKSKEELTQELIENRQLSSSLNDEIILPSQMPEKLDCRVSVADFVIIFIIQSIVIAASVQFACYRVLSLRPQQVISNMS